MSMTDFQNIWLKVTIFAHDVVEVLVPLLLCALTKRYFILFRNVRANSEGCQFRRVQTPPPQLIGYHSNVPWITTNLCLLHNPHTLCLQTLKIWWRSLHICWDIWWNLRSRGHGLTFSAIPSEFTRKNFLHRMLYKDIYSSKDWCHSYWNCCPYCVFILSTMRLPVLIKESYYYYTTIFHQISQSDANDWHRLTLNGYNYSWSTGYARHVERTLITDKQTIPIDW